MRLAACLVLTWMLAPPASAIAQGELESERKPQPKDSEVYSLVGGPMAKLFETFQAPENMFVADADTKKPSVCFDYGAYGYVVRDKVVRASLFWSEWKGPVLGVTLGETSDKVIEQLGKPAILVHDAAGPEHMVWNVKDNDREYALKLDFDKDKKLDRAVVRPASQGDKKQTNSN
jgi:hypothetical protein